MESTTDAHAMITMCIICPKGGIYIIMNHNFLDSLEGIILVKPQLAL